jgi:hypothetical protein
LAPTKTQCRIKKALLLAIPKKTASGGRKILWIDNNVELEAVLTEWVPHDSLMFLSANG